MMRPLTRGTQVLSSWNRSASVVMLDCIMLAVIMNDNITLVIAVLVLLTAPHCHRQRCRIVVVMVIAVPVESAVSKKMVPLIIHDTDAVQCITIPVSKKRDHRLFIPY